MSTSLENMDVGEDPVLWAWSRISSTFGGIQSPAQVFLRLRTRALLPWAMPSFFKVPPLWNLKSSAEDWSLVRNGYGDLRWLLVYLFINSDCLDILGVKLRILVLIIIKKQLLGYSHHLSISYTISLTGNTSLCLWLTRWLCLCCSLRISLASTSCHILIWPGKLNRKISIHLQCCPATWKCNILINR